MIEDRIFKRVNFDTEKLTSDEYENCTFIGCSFSQHSISTITFRECEFNECNFNTTLFDNTVLNDVSFVNCKLLGIDFSTCDDLLLTLNFKGCNLSFTSFYKLKLKGTIFNNSNLQDADFTQAELRNAVFDNCNLKGTVFNQTNLEQADFRTAKNYTMDPENNKLTKARFSYSGLIGLLGKYSIDVE